MTSKEILIRLYKNYTSKYLNRILLAGFFSILVAALSFTKLHQAFIGSIGKPARAQFHLIRQLHANLPSSQFPFDYHFTRTYRLFKKPIV